MNELEEFKIKLDTLVLCGWTTELFEGKVFWHNRKAKVSSYSTEEMLRNFCFDPVAKTKSLRDLYVIANESAHRIYDRLTPSSINITTNAMIQNWSQQDVSYFIGAFVRIHGSSISHHISVNANNINQVIRKFEIECESQRDQYIATVEMVERDTDFKIE